MVLLSDKGGKQKDKCLQEQCYKKFLRCQTPTQQYSTQKADWKEAMGCRMLVKWQQVLRFFSHFLGDNSWRCDNQQDCLGKVFWERKKNGEDKISHCFKMPTPLWWKKIREGREKLKGNTKRRKERMRKTRSNRGALIRLQNIDLSTSSSWLRSWKKTY